MMKVQSRSLDHVIGGFALAGFLLVAACGDDVPDVPDAAMDAPAADGTSPPTGDAGRPDVGRPDATDDGSGPTPVPDATPGDASPPGGGSLADVLSTEMFSMMFLHQGESACNASAFTYAALIEAARMFPAFGTTGSSELRQREVAAFLANASHETTGGWATAPDGPFAWGLCFREEVGCGGMPSPCLGRYCDRSSADHPCAAGQSYHGRGPMQLSWNYNYGQAAAALGQPLLAEPSRVAENGVTGWQAALWFWMTPQRPKPSCHDVMTGVWVPSAADMSAGRTPGFGMTVNIINGGLECGAGRTGDARVEDRIGFFRRYAGIMGVTPGENLTCDTMMHY